MKIGAYLTPEECERVCNLVEEIVRVIGYAQGRADSYASCRDEFKLIQFPRKEEKDEAKKRHEQI